MGEHRSVCHICLGSPKMPENSQTCGQLLPITQGQSFPEPGFLPQDTTSYILMCHEPYLHPFMRWHSRYGFRKLLEWWLLCTGPRNPILSHKAMTMKTSRPNLLYMRQNGHWLHVHSQLLPTVCHVTHRNSAELLTSD